MFWSALCVFDMERSRVLGLRANTWANIFLVIGAAAGLVLNLWVGDRCWRVILRWYIGNDPPDGSQR